MASQFLVNALHESAQIFLGGLGFTLLYSVRRFFDFTLAIVFILGGYTWWWMASKGFPLVVALLGAFFASIAFALIFDVLVYAPLRRRSVAPASLLLLSLGSYTVLQNCASLLFGDRTLFSGEELHEVYTLWGGRLTESQLVTIIVASAAGAFVIVWVSFSWMGTQFRAVASNPSLALVVGIQPQRVVGICLVIGAGMIGLSGALFSSDVGIEPTSGMAALVSMIVVMVIGGGSAGTGALLGALALGFARQTAGWYIGAQWEDLATVLLMLALLFIFPQGLTRK